MGKAPAAIIIARHGARLDAEDTTWLETAACPYDPPLTYGGWTQTRALGARIAALLRERDQLLDEQRPSSRQGSGKPKRRKRKVVIHSSPFLRCVQSSIAISAGIAQYQGNLRKFELAHKRVLQRVAKPTRSHTLDTASIEARFKVNKETLADKLEALVSEEWKPTLRIDAFLGEWLSPTYFETFSAPPASNMMVAGAKADLIKPASPIQGAKLLEPNLGDQKPTVHFEMPEIAEALPTLDGEPEQPSRPHKSVSHGYVPPAPAYAISASSPIPSGYVAHARNACVNLDFQWDSTREPQDWGDGGELGEEWASMHTRFRRGLNEMITWYKSHGLEDDSDDDAEEVIVVLVSHSAGCNALIGAITNHPVLIDVGMGSLTMAVHRGPGASTSPPPRRASVQGRRPSNEPSQCEEYEIKIMASMDHLRAGADPLRIPALASPTLSANGSDRSRRFSSSYSGSDGTLTPEEGAPNSALGSMRRSRATTYGARGSDSSRSHPGSGLWGSNRSTMSEAIALSATPSRTNSGVADDEDEEPAPSLNRSDSQRGLWGGKKSLAEGGRRWSALHERA